MHPRAQSLIADLDLHSKGTGVELFCAKSV